MDNKNKGSLATSQEVSSVPKIASPVSNSGFKNKIKRLFNSFGSKKKLITQSLGSLALIGFLAAGIFLVQQRQGLRTQAAGAVLSLTTSNANPKAGETFVVAVSIDTKGAQVSAADLRIRYKTDLFEAQSFTEGNFLPVVLYPASFVPYDDDSLAVMALGANPGSPKNGTGLLATITFKARKDGSGRIYFGPNTAVASIGQGANVVETMNPVQIRIGSVTPPPSSPPASSSPVPPGSSPSPSLSPSPSPNQACRPVGSSCYGNRDTRCCAPAVCRQPGGEWICIIRETD